MLVREPAGPAAASGGSGARLARSKLSLSGLPEGAPGIGFGGVQQKAQEMRTVIKVEGPEDMARLITTAKLALFREVPQRAWSFAELAERLQRDRSAVKRDIDDLEKAGLIEVEDMPLPGHGRKKEVAAVAEQLLLAI